LFWTTAKPVSSTSKISEGVYSRAATSTFQQKSQQIATCSLLKDVALTVAVPVGWQNESNLCAFLCNGWTGLWLLLIWRLEINWGFYCGQLTGNGLGILLWTPNWNWKGYLLCTANWK
jgi:hypothetical protein